MATTIQTITPQDYKIINQLLGEALLDKQVETHLLNKEFEKLSLATDLSGPTWNWLQATDVRSLKDLSQCILNQWASQTDAYFWYEDLAQGSEEQKSQSTLYIDLMVNQEVA